MIAQNSHYHFASFYIFSKLRSKEIESVKKDIYSFHNSLVGLIILAKEGINGTVAGSQESINYFIQKIKVYPQFQNIEYKYSQATVNRIPFKKLKVKIKKEIVTLGKLINTNKYRGEYIEPDQWNTVVSDPDVLLVDVRNVYEHRIGTFKNAMNPQIQHFRHFPQAIKKIIKERKPEKIVMFCTGGIRCEKASAYVRKKLRFKNVYQLRGGILKYFEEIPNENSLWEGKCFVFDGRITVNQNLDANPEPLCKVCGQVMLWNSKVESYICFQCIEYPIKTKTL